MAVSPHAEAAPAAGAIGGIATSPDLPGAVRVASLGWSAPSYSGNGGRSWAGVATTPWGDGALPLRIAVALRSGMANPVRLIVAASSPQSGSGPGPTIYRTGDGGETWAVFRDTATIGPDILNSFPEKNR